MRRVQFSPLVMHEIHIESKRLAQEVEKAGFGPRQCGSVVYTPNHFTIPNLRKQAAQLGPSYVTLSNWEHCVPGGEKPVSREASSPLLVLCTGYFHLHPYPPALEPSAMMECSVSALSTTVATSHMWLLSA